MSEAVGDRLEEVLELVAEAQRLLDQAVGRSVRLPAPERQLVSEHMVPPRTHLRNSADTLRQRLAEVQARALRDQDRTR